MFQVPNGMNKLVYFSEIVLFVLVESWIPLFCHFLLRVSGAIYGGELEKPFGRHFPTNYEELEGHMVMSLKLKIME